MTGGESEGLSGEALSRLEEACRDARADREDDIARHIAEDTGERVWDWPLEIEVPVDWIERLIEARRASSSELGREGAADWKEIAEAHRRRWIDARDALWAFQNPPDPIDLRQAADEIDCQPGCERCGLMDPSTGTTECPLSETTGCPNDLAESLRGWAKAVETRSALSTPAAPASTPKDVVRLVIAAREVQDEEGSADSLRELDNAAEAFASRVPWEDEPDEPSVDMAPPPASTPLPVGEALREDAGAELARKFWGIGLAQSPAPPADGGAS